jgi:uncharacterized protein DUF3987
MPILHLDFETGSPLPLQGSRAVGTWQYARCPDTRVHLGAFAVDDGSVQVIVPGKDEPPAAWLEAARDPTWRLRAFNASFERAIAVHILTPRFGWPAIPIEQYECTHAQALSYALPASLESVAAVLALTHQKDTAGADIMKRWAKPRAGNKSDLSWHDDPKEFEQLGAYCCRDVEVEREAGKQLPPLPEAEQALWVLSEIINERGFYTDGALIDACIRAGNLFAVDINHQLAELTGGAITAVNQLPQRLPWLREHGYTSDSTDKTAIGRQLRRKNLSDLLRQVLELRQLGAHAGAAKPSAFKRWRADDGRVHGAFKYHGAHTGRFTSLGVQAQNLKRVDSKLDVEAAATAVLHDDMTELRRKYPQTLNMIGNLARAMICARSGYKLIAADFSGIEPRTRSWLGNDWQELAQWKKFDATGNIEDEPYYIDGTRTFKLPPEQARDIGKPGNLAFGYEGGKSAYRKLAPNDPSTDDEIEARKFAWRRAHPQIKKLWVQLNRAALQAVTHPGQSYFYRDVTFVMEGGFLFMRLPSGRRLAYPFARIEVGKHPKTGEPTRRVVHKVWNNKKWKDYKGGKGLYGGLLTENAVSAIARDLFALAMHRVESAGYAIVHHSHDEIVTEVPESFGSEDEFRRLMVELPAWMADAPIAAKVRSGHRFCPTTSPKPSDNVAVNDMPSKDEDAFGAANNHDAPVEMEAGVDTFTEQATQDHSAADNIINDNIDDGGADDVGDADTDDVGDAGADDADDGVKIYWSGEESYGQPIATYTYEDAQRQPHARVTRTSAKKFPTAHWDGNAWINSWPTTTLPYRLPELLAAPTDEPVFVTEGEKDCLNAVALGLTATTNMGGAGKWKPELAQWFKGKQSVYVLEDNDEPGRTHAAKVAESLRTVVPAVTVISFPELPEKGDVSDWIDRGGNKKLLLARAEDARARPAVAMFDPWETYIVPPFPLDILPPVVRDFVREQSDVMGCDPAAAAMAALATMSGALHHDFALKMLRHGRWWAHPRLWVILCGDPSRKKTPIISTCTQPLVDHEMHLRAQYADEMRAYEAAMAARDKGEPELPEPPPPPRYLAWDTTTEKLGEILARSDKGILIKSDELAGWLGSMERYHSGGGRADRAFWLQAYDGGPYAVDRIKRGELFIKNLSVSIIGGIQPALLAELHGLTTDGLLQRFLPVMMASGRFPQDVDNDDEIYRDLIYGLVAATPAKLRLSDSGLLAMDAIRLRLSEIEPVADGIAPGFQSFIGKLAGAAGSLALILHLASTRTAADEVEADTVENVGRLIFEFILPHAREFYRVGEESNGEQLRRLASYVLTCDKDQILASDITTNVRDCRGLNLFNLGKRVSPLVAAGWLEPANSTPFCRTWTVLPRVRQTLGARAELERRRKAQLRELMGGDFAGRSKPRQDCQESQPKDEDDTT